jgi:hypothetical protein
MAKHRAGSRRRRTGFPPARAGISERLRASVDRQNLGIMDPTLAPQVSTLVSANDRRLLGVIGWDVSQGAGRVVVTSNRCT